MVLAHGGTNHVEKQIIGAFSQEQLQCIWIKTYG